MVAQTLKNTRNLVEEIRPELAPKEEDFEISSAGDDNRVEYVEKEGIF